MSIESMCPGCGRLLRVADEHLGRMARCPACNSIFQVGQKQETKPVSPAPSQPTWRLRTPEGQIYGPVTRLDLERWVTEGRVSADCWLSQTEGNWQSAADYYPDLRPQHNTKTIDRPVAQPFSKPVTPATSNPFRDDLPTSQNPSSPTHATTGNYRYTASHRGVLILVLGILSWVFGCFPIGIAAWAMGSHDLGEMKRGRMDPSGRGLTQAGQIVGMIHVIMTMLAIVSLFLVTLLSIVGQ
jgi:hypothetical protein